MDTYDHAQKDITVLWQGNFEGGTAILFLSAKYENILFWRIHDPGLLAPLTGNFFFTAGHEFNIEKFIEGSLSAVKTLYLLHQQDLKDASVHQGTKIQ